MSGSVYPALAIQTPDPARPQAEWADIAHQNALTGLTQQQAIGANLQNNMAGLMLGYKSALLGLGGPNSGGVGAMPPGGVGMPQPGMQPSGGMQAQPASDGGGAPGGPGSPVGPYAMVSPIGIPLPRMVYASAAMSQNPDEAFAKAADMRRQRLFEIASQATPQTWGSSVQTAMVEGWLTPQSAAYISQHPEMKQQFLQSLATPEANLGFQGRAIGQGVQPGPNGELQPSQAVIAAKGAITSADEAAKAPYGTLQEVTFDTGQKDKAGQPILQTRYLSPQDRAALSNGSAARPTTAADYANPNVTIDGNTFVGRLQTRESGNNPSATNGSSSAAGSSQFLPDTWVQMVKQARPDLAAGKTDAQIAAMRTDTSPQGQALVGQMTAAYAKQNAATLAQSGIPVNSMTLGLSHWFGAGGAQKILASAPNTALSTMFPASTLAANGLSGKTVGDATAAAYKSYGVNPVNFGAPQQAQPNLPGIGGAPVQTPQQKAALDVQASLTKDTNKENVGLVGDYSKTINQASNDAVALNNTIDNLKAKSQTWQPGKFADVKMDLASAFDSVGQSFGLPPIQSVGDWQTFNKNAMRLTMDAVKSTSARAAAQEFSMIQGALPADTTSPQALRPVFDEMQGVNDWKIAKQNAFNQWQQQNAAQGKTANPTEFDSTWNSTVPVGVFMLNRMNPADTMTLARNLAKTPEGRAQWQRWMDQAKVLHDNGILGGNNQQQASR